MLTNQIIINILLIIFIHWFADFFCQTSWQAENKSKRFDALTFHVLTYALITAGFWWYVFKLSFAPTVLFVFTITFFAHGLTDFVTSRITSPLFASKNYHWAFVVIGIDQCLHYLQLFLTAQYLHI